MVQQRQILRETVAFGKGTRRIVTIPEGSTVSVFIEEDGAGLCTVFWDGQILLATCDDIAENSELAIEPETLRLFAQPKWVGRAKLRG